MTDEELMYVTTLAKICTGEDFWNTHAVELLNVPSIAMCDGPSGLRKQVNGCDHLAIHDSIPSICFPTGSGLACSFDRNLAELTGALLGEECRAEGVQLLLAPAINIKRSPLCGRNFEYLSEDPYLTGELAYSYISGVQSKGVGACVKHFLANNQEDGRMTVDARISKRALNEIYLRGFKRAVEAQPIAVMSSYNRVNGEYVGESKYFLTDVLRGKWNFQGMVVSDWYAVSDRVNALRAGLDLEMPGGANASSQKLIDAAKDGTLSIEDLELSANRVTTVAKKLQVEPTGIYDKEAHHKAAVNIAKECAVLLKNDGLLPITKNDKVLLIGKIAHTQGGGSSHVNMYKTAKLSDELKGYDVTFAASADTVNYNDYDKIIVLTGLTDSSESEGFDRKTLALPDSTAVYSALENHKNVGVVLFVGSAVELPYIDSVRAVLSMNLAGEGCAEACAALLTARAVPCGKLAESYPISLEHNPAYINSARTDRVDYNEGVFVGYRYYTTKKIATLFPFGHGLSYTEFAYSHLSVQSEGDGFTVSVDVKNVGKYAAKEVVQLYISPQSSSIDRPKVELKGFEKIHLNRNERKTVVFNLKKTDFAYFDEELDDFFTEGGDYDILISRSAEQPVLSATVHVNGDKRVFELTDNTTLAQLKRHPKTAEFIDGLLSRFGKDEYQMILNAPLRLVKGAANMDDLAYRQFKQKINGLLNG